MPINIILEECAKKVVVLFFLVVSDERPSSNCYRTNKSFKASSVNNLFSSYPKHLKFGTEIAVSYINKSQEPLFFIFFSDVRDL